MTRHKLIVNGFRGLATTGLVSLLVACGGGGGSSSDDTLEGSVPIATRGVITQLGSIWVTGCRYVAAPGGTYKSDDDSASFNDYEVGQLVSIRGRRNDDGISCVADEVGYEAEIEGTADVDGKINGIEIVQTPKTNNTAPGAPDPLISNDRYEVSGIWIDDSTIEATFIKEDDDANDEIKGIVKNDGPTSFDVREITFNWTGTPNVSDDDFVEVHFDSCVGTAPNVICNATIVEFEDDVFDQAEGMEVEIEGAVDLATAGCPTEADFKVDGICIDSDTALFMDGIKDSNDLMKGSRVEAEGHMISNPTRGYLRADKIKGRGKRVRISSFATAKSGTAAAGSFKLINGNIDVVVSSATAFENTNFGNIDAAANIRLEVRGVRTGPKSMLAIRVKVEDSNDDKPNEHELRAEVDLGGADDNASTITVMQVTSSADTSTQLELDDDMAFVGSLSTFLRMIDDNDIASDGPRDIVEVRIDSSGPFYAEQIEIEEVND